MSDHIPFELLVQILRRLPARSLVRFRCVCKSWNSLISSTEFVSSHTQVLIDDSSSPNLLLLRYLSDVDQQDRFSLCLDNESFEGYQDINVPFSSLEFLIIDSCNGLLCLSNEKYSIRNSRCPPTTILWNPTIGASITLPAPRIVPHLHNRPGLGFGFDPRSNDYKIVRIVEDFYTHASIEVEIYELSTGSWRTLVDAVLPPVCTRCSLGKCFNGAIHWIRDRPHTGMILTNMLVFDLHLEVFREINLPISFAALLTTYWCVEAYKESLCLVQYRRIMEADGPNLSIATNCCIWVMKEYGVQDSWYKLFSVNLQDCVGPRNAVGLGKNGDVIIGAGSKLVSFNPEEPIATHLKIQGDGRSCYLGAYQETLVLLDRASGSNSADATSSIRDEVGPESNKRSRISGNKN